MDPGTEGKNRPPLRDAPTVIVVMGVAGSGKTTIGRRLAEALGAAFAEGDGFHSKANVAKMARGEALTDADRLPWLRAMAEAIGTWLAEGRRTVLACSALKRRYREILAVDRARVGVVYLRGDPALIAERLAARKGHYMPASLLASQLETLEEPRQAISVDIASAPDAIVREILRRYSLPSIT